MPEPEKSQSQKVEEEGPPRTPFDSPAFLPFVLGLLALWFGYDGFLNAEFIESHRASGEDWVIDYFNRPGAVIFGAAAALSGWRALSQR
jgi:hypothetical protein